ncbi:MAG: hypothetical protein ACRD59_12065 [Candidatus Acidiferrales bacterium]
MINRNATPGSRPVHAAIPFLLLVLAAFPAQAQTSALPDRLPANTIFYAYWLGMGSLTKAEKTNHVVQLFEDPQFALGRDALLKNFRNSIAKNGPATSEPETAEVLSLLDNPAVIGIVLNPAPAKTAAADKAPPPVGFFVVYDVHGKTAIVEKLRAANSASGKEVPTVMSYDFHGTKVEARATGTDVSYTALTPKHYFLADQKAVIEDLIARFGAAENPADSVTRIPEYKAIRAFVSSDASVEYFARIPDLSKSLSPEQLDKPGVKVAMNLHLDRVHVFGGSISFAGEATRFRGAVLGDTSAGTIFDVAGASGTSFVTWPVVSAGPIFGISRFNFPAIYQLLRAAALPVLPPQQAASVEMSEKMAQGFLGMPVSDALQLFTGELASQTAFADDGSSLKTYAVSIQKPQDVLRILRAVGGGFIVGEDTSGDTTFLDLVYPYTDPATGQKRRDFYYVAVTPTMLFAAPRKAAVREAMARLNAKTDAAKAVGNFSSPEFSSLRSLLPEKLSGLSAIAIAQIPWDKLLSREAQQMADAAKSSNSPPPSTDWLKAIKPEVLTRHLHFGVSGWWKDSSGIYFDSYVQ